jgi:D-tagatose-1,6-bisphosphate aldolase subunit GatZ/KbaZ
MTSSRDRVLDLLLGSERVAGQVGITSVCSAHPLVLEAACREAKRAGTAVLIEATCNQVNQDGGYTGMTSADFVAFVLGIARQVGLAAERVILGGDHLGPNPWKALPADEAMAKAEVMVAAFVAAGFRKIHLDCSMGCKGEPAALDDAVVAERAARLAKVAEAAAVEARLPPPVYIIGTEVPPPGGATHEIQTIEVTSPDAARRTFDVHREAFAAAGVSGALERVIGLVVQPGVEFGNANVVIYDQPAALKLVNALRYLDLVFEAHSTDYQPTWALSALVDDGFAILKVGPGLTFALREALYGLDAIARELRLGHGEPLAAVMERLMLAETGNWRSHYPGTPDEQYLQRHFSYSDRIRYYWTHPEAVAAVDRLMAALDAVTIPETLISQYLGRLYPAVAAGNLKPTPKALCLAAINRALAPYRAATTRGDELERLQSLWANTTPGPWKSFVETRDQMSGSDFIQTAGEDIYLNGATVGDQDFIAAAHEAVPALMAEIRRLKR